MSRDGTATRDRILDAATRLSIDQGFASTSLDHILADAGVTKGAFFHHFRSKSELGIAIVDRYARADVETLEQLWAQAERLSRDPLQQLLLFVGLFADTVADAAGNNPGCLYASIVYEGQLNDEAARALIADAFRIWRERIRRHLDVVAQRYAPRLPVDLDAVADVVLTANEGAYVLARATGREAALRDQILQVRNYLELLFSPAEAQPAR